ncbi:22859_t:CDS:2 [Rhizophagus irregularis]|nr:22859_t:CDS:2 [Rhizophagus irregularis]
MNQIETKKGKKKEELTRRDNNSFFEEDIDTSNDDNDSESEKSSEEDENTEEETSSEDNNSEINVINAKGSKKRRNKHAPMEMSSKRPVSRFRQIVEIPKSRDPRFDSLSGKFNEDLYEKTYSFLNEYKKSEIEQIKSQISKEKDPVEKSRLQQLLSKLLVYKGKKPYYYKKSDVKKLELIDKFSKLQESDPKVLEKVIEKRRKKNASIKHKYIPFKRRKSD